MSMLDGTAKIHKGNNLNNFYIIANQKPCMACCPINFENESS